MLQTRSVPAGLYNFALSHSWKRRINYLATSIPIRAAAASNQNDYAGRRKVERENEYAGRRKVERENEYAGRRKVERDLEYAEFERC
ncbi:hypothetical protein HO173_008640 [Letharia columbiana]|uniref:Uncharacterized protein n=1 Tax=Letharia columbiana TaxID=112416 RepID=A0A8H6L2H5_9LECA|nr:uncharacterized protein HO173_008640 [Letharia columbiana]KAF6233096.1 hypothetical protein HO173_008640 [Letharia columbiana]